MSAEINTAEIRKHLRFLETFTRLDKEMPAGQMKFLLTVALMEGASLRELAEACGLGKDAPVSTYSRYLANLSDKNQFNMKGLGLLYSSPNPANRRMLSIHLSPEGRKFLAALDAKKAKEENHASNQAG